MDPELYQPTKEEVKRAILHFNGSLVTLRSFKQTGPGKLRKIADQEFKVAKNEMHEAFGKHLEIRVPRSVKKQIIFIKKSPNYIGWENVDPALITREEYDVRFKVACHSSVGNGLKEYLIREGHVSDEF